MRNAIQEAQERAKKEKEEARYGHARIARNVT